MALLRPIHDLRYEEDVKLISQLNARNVFRCQVLNININKKSKFHVLLYQASILHYKQGSNYINVSVSVLTL